MLPRFKAAAVHAARYFSTTTTEKAISLIREAAAARTGRAHGA
jgi:hypothetical protein